MTIPRYITGIAVLYMATFWIILTTTGELRGNTFASMLQFWPLGVGAIVMAVLGTLCAMARFGDNGCSIYFSPTVVHLAVLAVMLVTAWGTSTGALVAPNNSFKPTPLRG